MNDAVESIEFEAFVDAEGKIALPPMALDRFPQGRRRKVSVRISGYQITADLKNRKVTEDEIQRIARTQLEPREQAVKFLLTEGTLQKHRAFHQRLTKRGGSSSR